MKIPAKQWRHRYKHNISFRRNIWNSIPNNGVIFGIQPKKTKAVRSTDAKHFRNSEDILDKPVLHQFVISNDLNIKDLGNGAMAIPAVKFLT